VNLVRRHSGVVWAVARQRGLRHADAADVYQNTWLALATSLGEIRDPARLRYWLATTAARQATKVAGRRAREFTRPDWEPIPAGDVWASPEAALLTSERDCLLWQAFAALPGHCRSLLTLFAHAPELSYAQAASVLSIPANSIGPRRGRCLQSLRRKVLATGILEGTR
jgi:RNA polymerase sigma factor (sigma-70 family)